MSSTRQLQSPTWEISSKVLLLRSPRFEAAKIHRRLIFCRLAQKTGRVTNSWHTSTRSNFTAISWTCARRSRPKYKISQASLSSLALTPPLLLFRYIPNHNILDIKWFKAAKNLMNAVVQTVKASYVASTKFKRMESNSSVVSFPFFSEKDKRTWRIINLILIGCHVAPKSSREEASCPPRRR